MKNNFNPPRVDEWQWLDESCNLWYPWYTYESLREISTWDLSDKIVLEFGGGRSTLWWATKAKHVVVVERKPEWIDRIMQQAKDLSLVNKITLLDLSIDPDPWHSPYLNTPFQLGYEYDIIISDDWYRDEVIAMALCNLKDGGKIICDNFDQDGIMDAGLAKRLVHNLPGQIYEQQDHKDHQGRKWKTAIWDKEHRLQQLLPDNTEYFIINSHLLYINSDYDSHRPMLWKALETVPQGRVMEFGSGDGSTMLLKKYCDLQDRQFWTFDNDIVYLQPFKESLQNATFLNNWEVFKNCPVYTAILFVDCKPGEDRRDIIDCFKNHADIIVVHDTEPGAEYVYHMQDVLNTFQYRCDLVIEGHPQTTAVSNKIDVSTWKGITMGKYRFV